MTKRLAWLTKLLVNNSGIKLLALLLAILTFFAIRNNIRFEKPCRLLVQVEAAKNMTILEQNPKTVNVVFRGSEEDLRRLVPENVKVVVRSKAESTENPEDIQIRPRDVDAPFGLRVVSIEPAVVVVKLGPVGEEPRAVEGPPMMETPLIGEENY